MLNDKKDLDGELKQRRRLLGMTQQDLANLLGVSLRTIRRWETGRCRVPYGAWRMLGDYENQRGGDELYHLSGM